MMIPKVTYISLGIAALVGCHRATPPSREAPGHWANVGRSCDLATTKMQLPAAKRDSLGDPFGAVGHPSPWTQRAAIARNIPGGWGGVTRRLRGLGFAIYLVDTTRRVEALDALARADIPYISAESEARPARWTYGELYDWFRYIHSHLRHVAVTMWTLDEEQNRIMYGVENEEAGLELDRQLTALGIPCFLVFRKVTGPVRLFVSPAPNTR